MKISRILSSVVVLGLLSSSAMAAGQFTDIHAPAAGERGQAWILGKMYGGTFALKSNGVDYTNGTITAQRLIDRGVSLPNSLSVASSGLPGDNQWVGPAPVSITVKAAFAAHDSLFGFYNDTNSTPNFVPMASKSSIDTPVQGVLPVNFRWAFKNTTTGNLFSSRMSDNVEGTGANAVAYDHLISYRILGLPNSPYQNEWALFWEDLKNSDCSDWDFNDAVIRVSTTNIPAPGAASLVAGVGLVGLRRRRR